MRAAVLAHTGGEGADVVIDTTGNVQAIASAPALARRGGTICAIRGVFRYANAYAAGVQLVASRRFPLRETVITHRLPLAAAVVAFHMALGQKDRVIKIVITP